ncbi:YjiK family protein [Pseudomonas aeruginosa]|nr:YjiK family protein [Pseudomonas aeruginosa]
MSRLVSYRVVLACLLAALSAALVAAQQQRTFERIWFKLEQRHGDVAGRERALGLADFRVDIEARVLGAEANVSALSFDPDRRSLVSVTNQDPHFLELSLDGELLRRIPLRGFRDPEAIEYVRPGVYVVAEERRQRLVEIHVDAGAREIHIDDPRNARKLSLGLESKRNKGFEGLAYDPLRQRLFVAREKAPVGIIEVNGFFNDRGEALDLSVGGDPRRDRGLFLTDLSSLYYHKASDHLRVLSDEARLVIELDRAGRPLGGLTLRAGNHGLADDVPQAEGLAMDDRGNLYLVSEPNLFYRFSRPLRAGR